MQVIRRSSRGFDLVPMDVNFLEDRTIFLENEITPELANNVAKQILYLSRQDIAAPINLMINSPGGMIRPGLMLYNVIQTSKTPVRMICWGCAYSMAALLFASGRSGRYMLAHSELMLHEPLLNAEHLSGSSSSIKSLSDSLQETRKKINQILSLHSGKSVQEIEQATSYDHYFDPDESVAFGLCDHIIGFDKLQEGI